MTEVESSTIHGEVSPGFEQVEEEFRGNFTSRREIGAAVAIYHHGERVVHLWGGYRDPETEDPWSEDTLVQFFSGTKGVAAMTMALARSRGVLDYDEEISRHWPEFAEGGKASITIRQMLSHQAGLCAIDSDIGYETMADWDQLTGMLARQRPLWEPGTRHGYHCWNQGWYLSEILRRADPENRRLGRYFQEEIAGPLGLEFHIGIPRELSVPLDPRIASVVPVNRLGVMMRPWRLRHQPYLKRILSPWGRRSITYRAVMNPRCLTEHDNFNKRAFRELEIPSANGIGDVNSVARLYATFAAGGKELGIDQRTFISLTEPPVPPPSGWLDEVLRVKMGYSLGFLKAIPGYEFAPSDKAFGFGGAAGGFAFADPEAEVGYAYAPNRVDIYGGGRDPREAALRNALYTCLDRRLT